MILFPAIDLIAGKVVRLEKGERNKMTVYSTQPCAVAAEFRAQGATWIHVVDLSAAFAEDAAARAANRAAIAQLCALEGLKVDVGGGVRDLASIEALAQAGADRIALGTAVVRDPDFARTAAAEFGELLTADVAAKDGVVKIDGWREGTGLQADDLVARLADYGFAHLVFTDIARDGMQTGIDAAAYAHISQVAGFPVVASGGISTLADIHALASLGSNLIEGAIVGRALYEGNFALHQALTAANTAAGSDAAVFAMQGAKNLPRYYTKSDKSCTVAESEAN